MENALRGKIFSMYPNVTSFAKAMKWNRKKASRIVNGQQRPTADEIEEIADLLNITDASDFVAIFFSDMSTKRSAAQKIDPLNFLIPQKG